MFRWIFARSCAALDVTIFATRLKNLWLALILIRTVGTLLMQKRNGTLIALFPIRTAFLVHGQPDTGGLLFLLC